MANRGATEAQLKYKFGWKGAKMAQEYIATSKPLLRKNASLLTGIDLDKLNNNNFDEEDEDEAFPDHAEFSQMVSPKKMNKRDHTEAFPDHEEFSQVISPKKEQNYTKNFPDHEEFSQIISPKKKKHSENVSINMAGANFSNCTVYFSGPK